MTKTYDLAVVGGGAAAFAASIKAADLGATVAMIEKGALGGTCVNVGCVPTKFLLTAGDKWYSAKNHAVHGLEIEPKRLDFARLMAQKDEMVLGQRQAKYSDVLDGLDSVELIQGHALFLSDHELSVDGNGTVKADKFVVATGSSAQIVKIQGLEDVDYLTNIEALELKELPRSMIVLGGRAVGLEFGQIFSRFGSRVTILQRSERIIPEEEPEISDALRRYLEDEGTSIETGVGLESVRKDGDDIVVTATVGGNSREFRAEKLLVATGRRPNTTELGLEKTGVELDAHGAIKVNDELQTTAANIWAAGDVIGEPMLETVAAKEGSIASHNALNGAKKKTDFSAVPHAVFTVPQAASVGLTDKQANEMGIKCKCRTLEMSMVPKALIALDTRGLIKMVTEADSGRILGVHILSPIASELIHEATLAVKFKLTIDDIIDTVHIFPAVSEAIKLVAQSFKRDIGKMSCCIE